ncbi:MAG TPA: metallopeptidase family protein [Pirellulales bacterium]|jgi:predicted Zn-dependent protease with MMP-like domain|nr:metallopeptidase family protein [Pirellulales bacterium]
MFSDADRDQFDAELEQVLAELPESIRRLLDEVPLYVEDRPSPAVLRDLRVDNPATLCGLYSGVPLTEPASREFRRTPDAISIYRAGIMNAATDAQGRIGAAELRRQIRITILHEMGHHHGLSEADLRDLGYG